MFDTTSEEFIEVSSRIMRAKQYVLDWQDNIDRWRKLYDLNHYKIKVPRENQYNDPTHTNTVDLSVGIMLANKMRWHAFGFQPSRKEQTDTGKIEKLIEGTWDINDTREDKKNLYELFLNFSRDGGGVIYSVFDPQIAADCGEMMELPDPNSETGSVEKMVYSEVPVRIQIIDPRKVFLLPGGPKRWLMIGRSEEMTVLDVESIYGVRIEKHAHMSANDKALHKGDFTDVWDYTSRDGKLVVRNTVTFDGQPIMGPRIMDGYKELPYTIQFFKPTKSTPDGWHNIMSAMEPSVQELEKVINRRSHQIDVYSAMPIVSRTQAGRAVQVDPGLFNHVQISTDESIEFPQWPGNAPDVELHVEFLRTRVNQSGFSDVMFGGGSGEAAGYAMAQQGDQNRIRLEQPMAHLELMLGNWAKKMIALLMEYAQGTEVCVYGHHKGKDYKDYVSIDDLRGYAVRAEIRPSFPAEETRKVAMASQSKGVLSEYTIMERYYDIEQPEDEQDKKMIDAASTHPLVIQYAIVAEMQERADAGDEIAEMVLQSMLAGQGADQAGRPEDPTSPVGFSAMPSATGQPTSQEKGGKPAGQSAYDQLSAASNEKPALT